MDFNLAVDKISIGNKKIEIKNSSKKKKFLWFILAEKLNAFF